MSQNFDNNLEFWHDKCIMISKCPGMIISSFSIMNGHMFKLTNKPKGILARTAHGDVVANQHWGICVKPVSG